MGCACAAAAQVPTPIAKWKANGGPRGCHLHSVHKQWRSIAPVTKPVWAWWPSLSNQGRETVGTHLPWHIYSFDIKSINLFQVWYYQMIPTEQSWMVFSQWWCKTSISLTARARNPHNVRFDETASKILLFHNGWTDTCLILDIISKPLQKYWSKVLICISIVFLSKETKLWTKQTFSQPLDT